MIEVYRKAFRFSVGAVILLALGACDLFVSDESRIQKATELRTQGEYRAAEIELKKVLKSHPENRDARFLLGEVSLLIGEAAAAERQLRRAQELGVPRDQIVPLLGQALLDQGRFDLALQELDPSGIGDADMKAEVLSRRGAVYLALGKINDAEGAFRELLALRANSLEARLGLAGVEQGRRNLSAAEAYIADVLSRDPSYPRGWLAKGKLELGRNHYALAEESFEHVLQLTPVPAADEFIARNGLAESQWRQGKSALALENVDRLMKLAPQHPRPKYLRASIAYSAGDYETAKSYLQQVLLSFPNYRPAALLLGATNYAQGEFEQADMHLSNVIAADPSSVSARKLLAATRLRQHRPGDAVAALTPAVTPETSDGQLLALIGAATLRSGDAEAGLLYLRRSAGTDPTNPALQMRLAAGYVSAGEMEGAIELLEKIPEGQGRNYARDLLLILAHLRKGDNAHALAQADKVVGSRPSDPGAYIVAGNAYMAAGQMRRAREHFEKALRLQPDSVTVLLNLGRLDFTEQRQDDARSRFERVLEINANNLNAMLALAQLSELREDQAGATQWLERAAASNPRTVTPKLLLVRHYLVTGDRYRARSIAAELVTADPQNPEVQNALGVVQMADRTYESAVISFRKAAAAAPRAPDYSYNLARAELARHRRDEAKKLLRKTLELDPGHLAARSTLAVLEMRDGKAREAIALARVLQANARTAAAGHVIEGDLYMMERQFESAAQAYDAIPKQAQSGALAIRSYQARRQARMPDAITPLEQWVNQHPDDARVRLTLGEAYQERGQLAQAAAQYELILKDHPEQPATLNNLAWVYHEAGDPRAIGTAERAHKLQPDNGAITDTLGWLLVNEGQIQRAADLLREAVRQAPDVPDIRYHLAVALAKSGAKGEARKVLAALMSSGQSFKDLGNAKQLLQQL